MFILSFSCHLFPLCHLFLLSGQKTNHVVWQLSVTWKQLAHKPYMVFAKHKTVLCHEISKKPAFEEFLIRARENLLSMLLVFLTELTWTWGALCCSESMEINNLCWKKIFFLPSPPPSTQSIFCWTWSLKTQSRFIILIFLCENVLLLRVQCSVFKGFI